MLGAGKYRAGKWGILGAMLGSLAGLILFGFWGIILGPILGAILGELVMGRERRQALKIGLGTFLGMVVGGVIKTAVILVMFGFLIASWF
jgi:hypothetical protein